MIFILNFDLNRAGKNASYRGRKCGAKNAKICKNVQKYVFQAKKSKKLKYCLYGQGRAPRLNSSLQIIPTITNPFASPNAKMSVHRQTRVQVSSPKTAGPSRTQRRQIAYTKGCLRKPCQPRSFNHKQCPRSTRITKSLCINPYNNFFHEVGRR